MSIWFGEPWPSPELPAPICEDPAMRVATPVGERCLHCAEEISSGDQGVMQTYVDLIDGHPQGRVAPLHKECSLRTGLGGPAHLLGVCTCQGGDCDPDMGMSARNAARVVWAWVMDRK